MSRTVLLVDDEPDVLFATCVALRAMGYSVIAAAEGREGLELAETCEPDAILLDLRMPGVDGWSVLEELRAKGTSSRVPVIVLSAHADPSAVERSIQLGASGYVRKPFRAAELAGALERVLA
ncbi:MAG: response regulator [Solirubrobacterales bacterium]|nr:response regulator [Solirubrobacterales bacterium]